MDTREMRRPVPSAAAWLGFTGAIPFVAGLVGSLAPSLAIVGPYGLLAYGAVILSFLGGVHWGLAMSADSAPLRLAASVAPSLVSWAALLWGGRLGLLGLAVAFAILLAFDLREAASGRAPAWYPALRRPLTAIVVACLALAGLAG